MLIIDTGQVVSSEIVMGSESGCPIEVHPIEIEKCDEMYDHECEGGKSIPFHRAGYDRNTGQSPNTPRQQVITVIHVYYFFIFMYTIIMNLIFISTNLIISDKPGH